jgi:crossover junction endodeoxyribonuclease RuvC
MSSSEKVVIGIDPGTLVTGYAVIKLAPSGICVLDFGCIKPPPRFLLSSRYHVIYRDISHLIQTHKATEMAIETPFIHKNPQSALKLGSALGCAIIAAKEQALRVYGYSPSQVKQGVTGLGSASKEEVEMVVRARLSLRTIVVRLDASDALAIALHHANASPANPPKEL